MRVTKFSVFLLALIVPVLVGCEDTDRPLSYDKGVYGGAADTPLGREQVEALRHRSGYQKD